MMMVSIWIIFTLAMTVTIDNATHHCINRPEHCNYFFIAFVIAGILISLFGAAGSLSTAGSLKLQKQYSQTPTKFFPGAFVLQESSCPFPFYRDLHSLYTWPVF